MKSTGFRYLMKTRPYVFTLLTLAAIVWTQPAHAIWPFGNKKSKKKAVKTFHIAEFRLKGAYPDRSKASLFGTKPTTYNRILKRIRMTRYDRKIKAVVFRFSGLQMGLNKAAGLRKTIQSLAKYGKKTYAILDSAGTIDYIVSTACQQVVMSPGGMLYLPGIRAQMLYYKKLLDKVGLAGDFITVGDFKTAPEPYLREKMSPSQRKQMSHLLGDLYDQMIEVIAKSRKLKKETVKKLVDQALLTSKSALQAKLIDKVEYYLVLKKQIKKALKAQKLKFVKNFGKKKAAKPKSLWSLFSLFLKPQKKVALNKNPKIAVVYAEGAINDGSPPPDSWDTDGQIWSDQLVATLEKVRKLKNLRAVILRVNSPGGSALASDLIWRKLEQIKKKVPLYVSMGRVAASGGYYIAMGADTLFAQPATITGSIGVFAGKLVMKGALNKIGVSVQSISFGKHSGIFSPYSRFSTTERATIKKMIQQTYREFVSKAAKGRKMSVKKMLTLAGGRVWTGRQAKASGLIDRLGSLQDVVKYAIKSSGLKKKPQILSYPRPKGFFEMLQSMSSGASMKMAQLKQKPTLPNLHTLVSFLPKIIRALARKQALKHRILMWSPIPKIQF